MDTSFTLVLVVLGVVAIGAQHLDATTESAPSSIAWGAATMAAAAVAGRVVERARPGVAAGGRPVR